MFAHATTAGSRHLRSVRSAFVLAISAVVAVHALLFEHIASHVTGHGPNARSDAKPMRVRTLDVPIVATPRVAYAKPAPRPTAGKARRPLRAVAPLSSTPEQTPTKHESAAGAASLPAPSESYAAGAGGEALPIYATEFPPSFSQVYELRRGTQRGHAELHWQLDAASYELRLTASLPSGSSAPGGPLLEWISRGGFDAAGLAPARFTDQRARRGKQAANFQRPGDSEKSTVRYSGPSIEHELPAGAQDRLSWMVQLAAIAQARGAALASGATIKMFVSGARGDADIWQFDVIGPQTIEVADASIVALKLVREPRMLYDTRAEVWLDPSNAYLPARIRLATTRHAHALELVLQPQREPR